MIGSSPLQYCTSYFLANGSRQDNFEDTDPFCCSQVDNDPLRMKRIILAGKSAREIRVAFPICAWIAVC